MYLHPIDGDWKPVANALELAMKRIGQIVIKENEPDNVKLATIEGMLIGIGILPECGETIHFYREGVI